MVDSIKYNNNEKIKKFFLSALFFSVEYNKNPISSSAGRGRGIHIAKK